MKKAVIEMQFNWIYVGIVGCVLLLLFINVAVGIRKNAQTKLAIDARNYFDEIFTSLQSSENTEHSVNLPDIELEIATEKDNCHFYTIGEADIKPQSTEYISLFSPNLIKKAVLSYSLGWDVPFRANYFLYLSSPDIAYVFVDMPRLENDLPDHLTKYSVSYADQFKNQNYYKIRFITEQNPDLDFYLDSSVAKLEDNQVSAIRIKPLVGDLYKNGEVTYYKKQGDRFVNVGSSFYLDKPTLFGAVYSERLDNYNCNLGKAVLRLNKLATILKNRISLLRTIDVEQRCRDQLPYYQDAASWLDQIIYETNSVDVYDDYEVNNFFAALKTIKEQLHIRNSKINKASCPTVY